VSTGKTSANSKEIRTIEFGKPRNSQTFYSNNPQNDMVSTDKSTNNEIYPQIVSTPQRNHFVNFKLKTDISNDNYQ